MAKRRADEMTVVSECTDALGAERGKAQPSQSFQCPHCKAWCIGSHRWHYYTEGGYQKYPRGVEEFRVQA